MTSRKLAGRMTFQLTKQSTTRPFPDKWLSDGFALFNQQLLTAN
jgi:hypothetical protein